MQQEKCCICLLVDNFSAHCVIVYQPTNIHMEFFELNITAFVAGEHEIYKINLLEAMMLAKKAWNAVTSKTMKHCWGHSQIEP
jgi:hypothetical protein